MEYETFGRTEDPTVLLIMGLASQLIAWDEAFCLKLAGRGFRVVRFDNRDAGLSSTIIGPQPDLRAIAQGDFSSISYSIDDMADDVASLLDQLAVPEAHIVGASMGGMIAQTFAIRHPRRTLSLCSIMSTTGNRTVGQADPQFRSALPNDRPDNREDAIARAVAVARLLSPTYFDSVREEGRAAAAFDRAFDPDANDRQLAAMMAQPDRTELLHGVAAPTLVIHGRLDPLITLSGGEATARAIPGARLLVLDEMGHECPEPLWPAVIDAITTNAHRRRPDQTSRHVAVTCT